MRAARAILRLEPIVENEVDDVNQCLRDILALLRGERRTGLERKGEKKLYLALQKLTIAFFVIAE